MPPGKNGGKLVNVAADCSDGNDLMDLKTQHTAWELDVRPLISSQKWISNYGLRKNKLTLSHILPSVGFKLSDDFDDSVLMKKPISSRYGNGMFARLMANDGKTFNITGSKQKLCQYQKRLTQAVNLYRRRLEWLTSESRRIFGVIEEKVVTIVLDIRNMSPQQFDQYRAALERVLREQISQLTKFNIIRAAEDCNLYSEECVPVTHDTVENAISWLWELDRLTEVSTTATCEAVMYALADSNNEAVYLFTEGSSIESSRELLKQKVMSSKVSIPLHVVSYNCTSTDVIKYLKDLVSRTKGRFHAYAVVMEMDAYESQAVDPLSNKANIVLKKKTYGGLPSGVGVREDVILIFEQLEEARNILSQITALLNKAPQPRVVTEYKPTMSDGEPALTKKTEHCMSSSDWIRKFGLSSQKLGLYDILSGVAFKHQDGVVEIMEKPPTDSQTDAVSRTKLINARYCDQFPVVRWRDGQVVHVQVTPDVHRLYEQRMEVVLQKIQQRVDWLKQGSREVFGTVLEDKVYILLDCSASMQNSLQFVKDRLFLLMQEQLRHKRKFNLISFNSKCCCWRDRLVEVNERNLQNAWSWVQGLTCWGSTNTYAAITKALNDPETEAMYLLTDGRPDQPPKTVLAQVQMKHRVPIHTISFNCNDTEANRFLYELARTTSGRYHYFSEEGVDPEQPESWESEDVQLLRQELKTGLENLEQLARLRDECSSMAWRRHTDDLKKSCSEQPLPSLERQTTLSVTESLEQISRPTSPYQRPKSAPPQGRHSPAPPARPSSSQGVRSSISLRQSISRRPQTARYTRKIPLVASHTRTSLLRTLNSSGHFSSTEWLLPETKQLFQRQADRKQELQKATVKKETIRKKRERKLNRLSETSSRVWLKKNGLVAKRLTILDALAPTFVPHRSKYVPILDRHVVAKVFDQILPLAHVSGRTKREIRLISPSAVDLDKYQYQVREAINQYHRCLDEIVWASLPESTKEEYKNDGPVSFWENREHLMNVLEENNWPTNKEDITLLLQEIEKGECFVQQAQDLQEAAKNGDLDEKTDKAVRSSVDQLSPSQEHVDPDHLGILEQVTIAVNESVKAPFPRDQLEDKPGEMGEEDSAPATTTKKENQKKGITGGEQRVKRALTNLRGQVVIARDEQDGLYYLGVVVSCPNPRYAKVRRYLDNKTCKLSTRFILPIKGAVSNPSLRVGDYVLIKVINTHENSESYVPGIVQMPPTRRTAGHYTAVLYNMQTIVTLRRHLVKISKERFDFTMHYLCQKQKEDSEIYGQKLTPREPDVTVTVEYKKSRRRRSRRRSGSGSDRNSSSRSRSGDRPSPDIYLPSPPPQADKRQHRSRKKHRKHRDVSDDRQHKKRSRSWHSSEERDRSRSQHSSNDGLVSRLSSADRHRSPDSSQDREGPRRDRSRSGSGHRSNSRSVSSLKDFFNGDDSHRSPKEPGKKHVRPSDKITRTTRRQEAYSSPERQPSESPPSRSVRRNSSPPSRPENPTPSGKHRSKKKSQHTEKDKQHRSDSKETSKRKKHRKTDKDKMNESEKFKKGYQVNGEGSDFDDTELSVAMEESVNDSESDSQLEDQNRKSSRSEPRQPISDRSASSRSESEHGRISPRSEPRQPMSDRSVSSGGVTARLKEHEQELSKMLRKMLQDQEEKHRHGQEELKRQIEDLQKLLKERQHKHHIHKHYGSSSVSLEEVEVIKEQLTETSSVHTSEIKSPEVTQPSVVEDVNVPPSKDKPEYSLALLELRRSLPPVLVGEEVLARWSDEGWYYIGRVEVNCQDFSYMVVDSTGEIECIWREDIITDKDDSNKVIEAGDVVIGLHPDYSFSYAPAKVVETLHNHRLRVCFYDTQVEDLQRDKVFKIPHHKYNHDVREIKQCEEQWVGKAVIARDDNTGIYRLGCVQKKMPNKRSYVIQWCDGTTGTQTAVHMFGAFTRRHKLAVGERVLAITENFDYLPGWVVDMDNGYLKVKFCNGAVDSKILREESFWLSIDYFVEAYTHYKLRSNLQT